MPVRCLLHHSTAEMATPMIAADAVTRISSPLGFVIYSRLFRRLSMPPRGVDAERLGSSAADDHNCPSAEYHTQFLDVITLISANFRTGNAFAFISRLACCLAHATSPGIFYIAAYAVERIRHQCSGLRALWVGEGFHGLSRLYWRARDVKSRCAGAPVSARRKVTECSWRTSMFDHFLDDME